ncbi:MAG: hypothetical protein KGJ98_03870 [Chloroflexota bacterium]|nr:hypothetical protein [Chloroflexota bacterium]MDE3101352.1 hypothetical protein [Chloroflexota bacterium]
MRQRRRVTVCGDAFDDAVGVLGLERVDDAPDVVLLDLADAAAIARAATIDAAIPRVATGHAPYHELLSALGVRVPLVDVVDAATVGPLIAAALPAAACRATRTVVVTGPSGGVGRTLLAVGLATRLAARSSVAVIDLTGTGAAGWWLSLAGGTWSDLEGLADELTAEHLTVVAAEEERIRLVGGTSSMPSVALARAAVHAAAALADLVIVDAPVLSDERTSALRDLADRLLLVVADDRASAARLAALEVVDDRVWVIGSRTRSATIGGVALLRTLPDDPAAVRAASGGPTRVAGALGRAYDDLAELLAIDAS